MKAFASILSLSLLTMACGPGGPIDTSSTPSKTKDDRTGGGDASGVKTDPSTSTATTTFELANCGFPSDFAGTGVRSQQLAMEAATISTTAPVLGGIFQSKKDVAMSGSFVIESSLAHQTVSYKSIAAPANTAAEVTAFIDSSTGSGSATLLDATDRAKIGQQNPEWAGTFCTLQPATRIEHNDDKHVATEFSQPIPFGLVVLGDSARVKQELGSKKSWTKITAKVVESTQPALAVGTEISGTVTSEPVTPDAAYSPADLAVRLTYNFGDVAKNKLLGLPVSIVWYVDSVNHKITAVQVDTSGSKMIKFK